MVVSEPLELARLSLRALRPLRLGCNNRDEIRDLVVGLPVWRTYPCAETLRLNASQAGDPVKMRIETVDRGDAKIVQQRGVVGISEGEMGVHIESESRPESPFSREQDARQLQ
jgi:hypothetical protein